MIDLVYLTAVEREVEAALGRGETPAVPIIGAGEVSVVLGLSDRGEDFACKRMPRFPAGEAVPRYRELCGRYAELLTEQLGLHLPRHEVLDLDAANGQRAVYYVQERLPAAALAHKVLAQLPTDEGVRLLELLFGRVARLAEHNRETPHLMLGLDAQVSNWVVLPFDGARPSLPESPELWYLDTSTPFLRVDGAEQLDLEILLSSLPAPLVPVVRLFLIGDIIQAYYEPRRILVDVLGNLIKERLDALLPGGVAAANRVLQERCPWLEARTITEDEVRKFYKGNARTWELLQRLRRADRFVKRKLLRRPYPFLLPDQIER
ncbi:MAG: hypothetical protein IT371_26930 [Deltaproteobacteria bacterium]|nr:hypothetical protein [Deltaproteobacteria bacterium]